MSLLVRFVLTAALALESRALGDVKESRIELAIATNSGKTWIQIEKILEEFHVGDPLDVGEPSPEGMMRVSLQCRLPRRHRREFLNELASLPEVKGIKKLEQ